MTTPLDAPASDEIEVSLFGPGYGESTAVHVTDGDWLVVDSCVGKDKTTPAALAYLKTIGVEMATAVKLVVATHWHDDHVRGIAEVHRACTAARFVCSQALNTEDFFALALASSSRSMMESSGVDELGAVLRELRRRKQPPRWAIAERSLWCRPGAVACNVLALSPTDSIVTRALASIGQLVNIKSAPKRRVAAPRRNDGAVVLSVTVGNVSVLLGADLPGAGWQAIVSLAGRPPKAKVYKVAHHGAASADHPRIWSDLLLADPVAVLTPWSCGGHNLPTSSDRRRLRTQTPHVFATAPSATERAQYRPGPVGRTMREALRNCRKALPPGHVRVRMNVDGGDGRCALFSSAVALGTNVSC